MTSKKLTMLVRAWQSAPLLQYCPLAGQQCQSRLIQMFIAQPDKSKAYTGMFWPVTITSSENSSGKYRVVYDNGETELVKSEHVHDANTPVEFGREGVDLQV